VCFTLSCEHVQENHSLDSDDDEDEEGKSSKEDFETLTEEDVEGMDPVHAADIFNVCIVGSVQTEMSVADVWMNYTEV